MISWLIPRTASRRQNGLPKESEQIIASDPATVYNVVAAQMQQHDLLMWQVPVLSLTAQAFLFTIILGGESSRTARILASTLAVISSILSMQLMAKHHWYRQLEWKWLGAFEEDHHLEQAHKRPQKGEQSFLSGLIHQSSYNLWQVGLALFGVVSTLCLVLAVIKPHIL
jgi:hypothetical protein